MKMSDLFRRSRNKTPRSVWGASFDDAPGSGRSPWAVALVAGAIFVVASSLNLWRISEGQYFLDEAEWIRQGEITFRLFSEGDFEHRWWSRSRLSYGYPSPNVPKLLIGLAMRTFGPTEPSGPASGSTPTPEALAAARLPSALVGALGVASLFLIGHRIAGSRVALCAAILLMTSPVWLVMSRAAMLNIHAVSFWLLAVFLFARSGERAVAPGRLPSSLLLFAATGCALGLSVGSRFEAGGPAIALGLLVVWMSVSALRSSGPHARSEAVKTLLGGFVMTAAALGVFLATHPYLHEATARRVLEIVEFWQQTWADRAENAVGPWSEAYEPGARSVSEVALAILLPGVPALCAFVPALLGVCWYRFGRPRRAYGDSARVALWSLAALGMLVAAVFQSRVILSWIVWAGLIGALLGLRLPGEEEAAARGAFVAFLLATLGALSTTLAGTHISWPRYFLPLVPFACLLAAWSLSGLVGSLFRSGRSAAGLCVTTAGALGVLVVLACLPHYGKGSMGNVAELQAPRLARGLQIAAASTLMLFPLVALRRHSAEGGGSDSSG